VSVPLIKGSIVTERTLSIIKPDGVSQKVMGRVLSRLETEGFRIVALKVLHMSKAQAEGFYAVHRERPFFGSLTDFMSEGPCVPMVLERDNAIAHLREVMGATDPAKAEDGTIRKMFATNVERNIIHGSDSPESAATEIAYFFNALELV
jgi:nucleoside-diphosphate kinase